MSHDDQPTVSQPAAGATPPAAAAPTAAIRTAPTAAIPTAPTAAIPTAPTAAIPAAPEPSAPEALAPGRPGTEGTVWFGQDPDGRDADGRSSVQDSPAYPPDAPTALGRRATGSGSTAAPPSAAAAQRPTGPNPVAILLGLLCVFVAVATIVHQLSGATLHWGAVGPGAIVAVGAVFLLAGGAGLLRRR